MHIHGMNRHHAPGILTVLGAFFLDAGLLGVFWFAGMIFTTAIWVLGVYLANAGSIPDSQPGTLASTLIGVSALYLSIIALWVLRGKQLSVQATGMTKRDSALLAVGCGLALCLLMMFTMYLLNQAGLDLRPGNQALLEDAGKNTPLLVAMFTIMVAPVFEEILFRKHIFARFQKEGYAVGAYILSSILFAFMHEPQPSQGIANWLILLLLYALMGAVFAWVYQKTGRLWSAMLAHSSNNLLAVAILFLA